MPRSSPVSFRLMMLLGFAIAFDTLQQLAWKMGMVALPDTETFEGTLKSVFGEPLLGVVAILMVLRLMNWLKVLELADLSYAQPITALSYVLVTGLSAYYLKETLTPLQLLGMAIILAGVWCISQTEKRTQVAEAPTL